MLPLEIGHVLQCRLIYETAGRQACNIRNWVVADVAGAPDVQQVAQFLVDNFLDTFVRIIPPQVKLRFIAVWDLDDTSSPAEAVIETNQVGIWTASDLLPPQLAGLVTFTTTPPSKRNPPKMYTCFPPETANGASGIPSPTYVTRIRGVGDAFVFQLPIDDGVSQATLDPVVYHRATHTTTLITGRVASLAWATQRRRGHVQAAPTFIYH